jgi:hypothetical protein
MRVGGAAVATPPKYNPALVAQVILEEAAAPLARGF